MIFNFRMFLFLSGIAKLVKDSDSNLGSKQFIIWAIASVISMFGRIDMIFYL